MPDVIYCDLDGTVVDFSAQARKVWMELAQQKGDGSLLRGAYMTWNEFRSPRDVCGDNVWREIVDKVHSDDSILAQPVLDVDCVEILNKIAENYELYFISNRRPDSYEATHKWLEKNFKGWVDLICTEANKNDIMEDGRYLIDDRPRTIVEFRYQYTWHFSERNTGPRKVFSLLTDYNRNLTDIPNVFLAPNWKGLDYYFKREGIYD